MDIVRERDVLWFLGSLISGPAVLLLHLSLALWALVILSLLARGLLGLGLDCRQSSHKFVLLLSDTLPTLAAAGLYVRFLCQESSLVVVALQPADVHSAGHKVFKHLLLLGIIVRPHQGVVDVGGNGILHIQPCELRPRFFYIPRGRVKNLVEKTLHLW